MVRQRERSRGSSGEQLRLVWLLIGAILLTFLLTVISFPYDTPIRIGLISSSFLLAVLYILNQFEVSTPVEGELGAPRPKVTAVDEVKADLEAIRYRYDPATIGYFVQLLVYLPRYLMRVTESATIVDRSVDIDTTLAFALSNRFIRAGSPGATVDGDADLSESVRANGPSDEAATLLIPMIVAKRGQLFEQLKIVDGCGGLVPILPQRYTRALLVMAVETLLIFGINKRRGDNGPTQATLSEGDERRMWDAVAEILCAADDPKARADAKRLDGLGRAFDFDDQVDTKVRKDVEELLKVLFHYYVIVAEPVRPQGLTLLLKYSHVLPMERPASHYSKLERLRSRFGLAPSLVDIVHARVVQAESFHFQLKAPAGQYIFHHRLAETEGNRWLTQDDFKTDETQHYVRTHFQRGSAVAHLYARAQKRDAPLKIPPMKSVIELRDIPPGALGFSAILAMAGALIQFVIALSLVGRDPNAIRGNIDVVAFILALPAFVGALGSSFPGVARSHPHASLSAYFGVLGTITLSVLSAVSYLLFATRSVDARGQLSLFDGQIYVETNTLFLPFMIASALLAIYLSVRTYHELQYFLNLPGRALAGAPGGGQNRLRRGE